MESINIQWTILHTGGFLIITLMPCMGVGKVAAQVSRTAAYLAGDGTDKLEVLSIPLLFTGDPDEKRKLTENPLIAIDGCNFKCASHLLNFTGISPAARIFVVDITRETKRRPGKARQELDEEGKALAQHVAEAVVEIIPKIESNKYPPQEAGNLPSPEDIEYEKKDGFYIPAGAPGLDGVEPAGEGSSKYEVCLYPCAGINRPEAQVSQLAAYKVAEENRLVWSDILCLPALLAMVEEDVDFIINMPILVIDGCSNNCASRMCSYKGVAPAARLYLPDIMEEAGLDPLREGCGLNKEGRELSGMTAMRAGEVASRLMNEKYAFRKQEPNLYGFRHFSNIDKEMGYKKKGRAWVPENMPDLE